jgi:hypothetical protein
LFPAQIGVDPAFMDGVAKLGIGIVALIIVYLIVARFLSLLEKVNTIQSQLVSLNSKQADAGEKRDKQIDLIKEQMQKDGEAREKQAGVTEAMAADVKELVTVNKSTDQRLAEDRQLNREMIERYTKDTNDVSSAIAAQAGDIKGAVTQAESNLTKAIDGARQNTLNSISEASKAVQDILQDIQEQIVNLQQQVENLKLPDPELAQMKAYLAEQINKLLGYVGNPAVDRTQAETLQQYIDEKIAAGFPVGDDKAGVEPDGL